MKYKDNEYDRRTGRSTARRLLALTYACFAPGTEVEFKDHMPNTRKQAERHRNIIKEYAYKLNIPVKVFMRGKRVFVVCNEGSGRSPVKIWKNQESLAEEIATELLSYHLPGDEKFECTRLQLMLKCGNGSEVNMGGRCKENIKDTILRIMQPGLGEM